ncbi:6-carboxyhexanoate--CoA ligase [Pampinifervens florentissimum]|uniref:6-carboxyhexanoate--CoA ligase n=1 Tax=Pampinifervens florentissimum TaxID=1632019 RepID=UPI0013B49640|nr:6-carboxyhexanoate--CoA ligase [Hydrogenobacter sp. T-8]QID33223.1 6-carboxyhexanoate--CoA ligase [Hydrogenobacter sp. T-8]
MLSLRMRAELKGQHISGAERLIKPDALQKTIKELIKRPKAYDKMVITLERVEEITTIPKALTIYSYDFKSVEEAHNFAIKSLSKEGIPEEIALKALETLKRGANPKGGNMRGAVLMDIHTGERLEPDKERGIRTVRVDWKDRQEVKRVLRERGLKKPYLERLLDALALATKNIHCGVIAELCWSDDPDYITGYIAGKNLGYVRIKPMKEYGVPLGGRVYFVRREGIEKLIECLQNRAVLIENL